MTALRHAVHRVVDGYHLTRQEMTDAMGEVLGGTGDPALLSALAVSLRIKGETDEELLGAAQVMRAHCRSIQVPELPCVVDTCGTGGDGLGTFNVSTAAAFVVAACGVPVAKHGNRAVSSRAGSADVLEALGLRLDQNAEQLCEDLRELGLAFLYAPTHHQALRHAAPVRKALGLRTFFNLLGPLSNPAGATHQLVGVYDPARVTQLASVLGALGSRGAWVVHGAGGLDEISPLGPTQVACLHKGKVSQRTVSPSDFGLPTHGSEALAGGDAKENAALITAMLEGHRDARRDVVVMNAAAALSLTDDDSRLDLKAAARRAEQAIDSGKARELLGQLRKRHETNARTTSS